MCKDEHQEGLLSDEQASRLLEAGEIIAFPTETLYGFACDPCNTTAVEKLCALKERPPESGIPLIAAGSERILSLLGRTSLCREAETSTLCDALEKEFWPGPLTLVLELESDSPLPSGKLASEIFGPGHSIAVRVSESPIARRLAELSPSRVITATSANRRGLPAATSVQGVLSEFPDFPIYGGGMLAADALPSSILDVRSCPFVLLREGAIPRSKLRALLGGNLEVSKG